MIHNCWVLDGSIVRTTVGMATFSDDMAATTSTRHGHVMDRIKRCRG